MSKRELNYNRLCSSGAKMPAENMLWRDTCWRLGHEDSDAAQSLWIASSRDILFWANTFVWIQEVRGVDGTDSCVPFITYPFQDEAVLEILGAVEGQYDFLTEKSRDMGATYMNLLVLLHQWLFRPERNFMVTSRSEDLVDRTDDVDSLFGKLEYMVKRLPSWMAPKVSMRTRSHMKFLNDQTGSIFTGSATSKDAGVGGRSTAILLDEFALTDRGEKRGDAMLAATRNNTACRLFNSTPRGIDTAYYRMRQTGVKRISLHWTRHPHKSAGMYRVNEDGSVELVDRAWHDNYEQANGAPYPFILEMGSASAVCREMGVYGMRSPYYDVQCKRTHSPLEIAQEEDIDYIGTGQPFFDAGLIQMLLTRDATPPLHTGQVSDFVRTSVRDETPRSTRVWYTPRPGKIPDMSMSYTIGVDVSMGTGASDSAISVYSDTGRHEVLEFASNRILPEHLAQLTADIYHNFTTSAGEPFLIWDGNGPGQAFGKRIIDTHRLANIFYYTPTENRGKAKTRVSAGWPSNAQLKYALFEELRASLSSGAIHIYSGHAIRQLEEYVHDGNNSIRHVRAEGLSTGGNAQQHGDVGMTKALVSWAYRDYRPMKDAKAIAPFGSFGWRFEQRRREDSRRALERTMFG